MLARCCKSLQTRINSRTRRSPEEASLHVFLGLHTVCMVEPATCSHPTPVLAYKVYAHKRHHIVHTTQCSFTAYCQTPKHQSGNAQCWGHAESWTHKLRWICTRPRSLAKKPGAPEDNALGKGSVGRVSSMRFNHTFLLTKEALMHSCQAVGAMEGVLRIL